MTTISTSTGLSLLGLGLLLSPVFPRGHILGQDAIPTAITPSNNSGDLPYSAQIGSSLEHVDVSTGNLIVTIPIVSLPGRKTRFDFAVRYDASFWSPRFMGSQFAWAVEKRPWMTSDAVGWTTSEPTMTHSESVVLCETDEEPTGAGEPRMKDYGGSVSQNYIFTDSSGGKHATSVNHQRSGACPKGNWDIYNPDSPMSDQAGYWFHDDDIFNRTVLAPDGSRLTLGGNASGSYYVTGTGGQYTEPLAVRTDLRGNQQVMAAGGVDTIGRLPVAATSSTNQVVYTVKDSQGNDERYVFDLSASRTLTSSFNVGGILEGHSQKRLLTSLMQPNGKSYIFTYDGGGTSTFGEITNISLPEGGSVAYEWGPGAISCYDGGFYGRSVSSRTVNDGASQARWDFTYSCDGNVPTVTVTDPYDAGGVRARTIYRYDPWQKITSVEWWTSANGSLLKRVDLEYGGTSLPTSFDTNPQLLAVQTSLPMSGQDKLVSRREFDLDMLTFLFDPMDCSADAGAATACQDMWFMSNPGAGPIHKADPFPIPYSNGNATAIREYDWGLNAPGALLKQTLRRYAYQDNPSYAFSRSTAPDGSSLWKQKNIVSQVIKETIYDGSVLCSGKGYLDENGLFTPPPTCQANKQAETSVTYDTGSPTSYGYYGEPTKISRWLNAPGQSDPATRYDYDSYGNLRHVYDANGNPATTIEYEDRWASMSGSNCQPSHASFVYPTTITDPKQHQTKISYFPCTGLKQETTNSNDIAAGRSGTTYTYDGMNRTTLAVAPDTGGTETYYDDGAHTVLTKIRTGTGTIDKLAVLDGLGRTVHTQLSSDPFGTTYVDTIYDPVGQVWKVSNPYRSNGSLFYTETKYDALGRVVSQTYPSGAVRQSNYTGNMVDIYDENQRHWKQATDSLGRLAKVWEPDPATNNLSSETAYSYDALGNLKNVNQKGSSQEQPRTRSFIYDSLSRLITSTNPETGTICYGQLNSGICINNYDGNGNLRYKTDFRGIAVSYAYDALNRLVSKTYPVGSTTPSSCYSYDESAVPNAIGRLTTEWTQKGPCASTRPASYLTSRAILEYDTMGRVKREQQCTPANCAALTKYALNYSYDLAGNVTQGGDGIGPISWQSQFDSAGRLSTVTGITALLGPRYPSQLFNATTYGPVGLTDWLMGGSSSSNPALTFHKDYDNRLRVTGQTVNGHQ